MCDSQYPVLEMMRRAVASIPDYVSVCDYLVVVAPSLLHLDTGNVCDYTSWSERGWCRLELWSSILREDSALIMLVVQSECLVELLPSFHWPRWRVAKGTFTVESDRGVA